MKNLAKIVGGGIAALCLATALPARAAQLSGDARAAIPHDVQQLIVIDYRAMQNSPAAMQLKNKVMPPELKSLEKALQVSGMNDNHDVDELAFAVPTQGFDRRCDADHRSCARAIFARRHHGQLQEEEDQARGAARQQDLSDGRIRDAGGVSQPHHDDLRPDRFAEAGAGCP